MSNEPEDKDKSKTVNIADFKKWDIVKPENSEEEIRRKVKEKMLLEERKKRNEQVKQSYKVNDPNKKK